MKYTTLFIDLDGTVYDERTGLWDQIGMRMNEYMQELLQLSLEDTIKLRRSYYESYGTTLRGLQINHQVDADAYLAYVHDIPVANYLKPDPALRELLDSLPQKKYIFTNADEALAIRTLDALGLRQSFDGIIDIRLMNYHCKPEPEAYETALNFCGLSNPSDSIVFDDSERNLVGARDFGYTTVLVGRNGPHPEAHYYIQSLIDLPEVLPELWEAA
jgi:putative hydrolase of the HAD superfamily